MTNEIRLLDGRSPEECAQWERLWARWPGREVWAHPSYVRLFAPPGGIPLCATADLAGGGILCPMIVRPLGAERWAAEGEKRWDATSPYGYGGAFAWGSGQDAGGDFWPWLEGALRGRGVVALFCRKALFQNQLLDGMPGLAFDRHNVVRSTDGPIDTIWRDYAHKVRKNVKRARAAGLVCEVDTGAGRLGTFVEIYHETLRRRGASDSYYFEEEFFSELIVSLAGQFAFFHVLRDEEVMASELILVSADHVYSYLGGTREAYFDLRPNDLLKHSVTEWAHREGKSAFVLGGGAQPEDGIFRYKLSFAPEGQVPFFTGKWLLDPAAVASLVRQRVASERAEGRTWAPSEGFFPPYRS